MTLFCKGVRLDDTYVTFKSRIQCQRKVTYCLAFDHEVHELSLIVFYDVLVSSFETYESCRRKFSTEKKKMISRALVHLSW